MLPSESISFVTTFTVTEIFSFVLVTSSTAFGASLTGVTVMIKVSFTQIAGSGVPLSHIETTIVSLPLNPAFGV